ncbi:MAG: type II toxin-antitoxin system HipA family toxin [Moritella sp.]|uniref:type II toxin-antitoxin system HipA family toxin n=1 Tax=Moritella sp. TaxID=78556 RepID=UPI001D79833E|nr:type II toxin-antitoxin system HipA family toxin [Moritella sp.]NQZ49394.1 type II toxin-antitoxin system HipA family toxin [Moritella sp.]
MDNLNVAMNGYLVGALTKTATGAHTFTYSKDWLTQKGARPISLSLPLRAAPYKGDTVYNFFDNLLPDNTQVRDRVVARHGANSNQPFDLLAKIGRDSVGALQIYPQSELPADITCIEAKLLDDMGVARILNGYQSAAPLGMIADEDEFRISIAGAQEKTALLKISEKWYLPQGSTPTTHIIKLPIGTIQSHSFSIDLSDSVENEFVCMLLAKEYGLETAECSILNVEGVKALAVKRFDRKRSADNRWIIRLPQEDFCQVMNVSPGRKYEQDGGPGIKDIMHYLLSSDRPAHDRAEFLKAQVLFWLLAASDGHAKNFSVFIKAGGGYQLTPLYDIMSSYPLMGGSGLRPQKIKLAMGLYTSKEGSQTRKYNWLQLFPRHFMATAKTVGFSDSEMQTILTDFKTKTPEVIERVRSQLPDNFPEHICETIFTGITKMATRL